MNLLESIVTALPFYRVPLFYVGTTSAQKPFYFQKVQCLMDCFFGTITDRKHLPSFVVETDIDFNINPSTNISFNIICSNGAQSTPLTPLIKKTVIDFVNQAELDIIEAAGPVLGDTYYFQEGDEVLYKTWNGAAFTNSEVNNLENDLMEVLFLGAKYIWKPNQDINENPNLNGEWLVTLNGFQLCNIGDKTLLFYSGFEVSEMPCGLQQVEIVLSNYNKPPVLNDEYRFLSELVDVKSFEITDNKFHKLRINNICNVGNIPYANILFPQIYYFNEDTLVGEPQTTSIKEKEEDGLGNDLLIFSKNSKIYLLETKLVPEYIIDFFNFSALQDFIYLTYPYELTNSLTVTSQYQGERTIDNNNFIISNDWIDSACYSTVKLEFALEDPIIDSSCCQELDKQGCLIPTFEVLSIEVVGNQAAIEGLPPALGDCYLIKDDGLPSVGGWSDHQAEIACWNGVDWDYTLPTENLLIKDLSIASPAMALYFYTAANGWKKLGEIECTALDFNNVTIKGYILQGMSANIQYRKDSEVATTSFKNVGAAELLDEVVVDGLDDSTTYKLIVRVRDNNCDYGYGDEITCSTTIP